MAQGYFSVMGETDHLGDKIWGFGVVSDITPGPVYW